ncbi:MAG TPA: EF-hand domain-containing protein [Gammaproteobacteria bacterium]|nr:EF-hand domain-containing protein [Gammaproteobacteria bacterium]
MRIRLSFVSALTLLIGTAVWAQGFTPPTFDGIDKDKNGKLSKEEVAAWVKTIPAGPNGPVNADELFARWDANKDGSVSKEEFENRPRPQGPGGGAPPPATK